MLVELLGQMVANTQCVSPTNTARPPSLLRGRRNQHLPGDVHLQQLQQSGRARLHEGGRASGVVQTGAVWINFGIGAQGDLGSFLGDAAATMLERKMEANDLRGLVVEDE